MELSFTLSRGELVLKAKDETYLAVRSYLVAQEANQKARYEMQADERETHERKLLSAIPSSVASLKGLLHRYSVADTLSDDKDEFSFSILVTDRFRTERKEDISRLVSRYIYLTMVAEWWEANYPDAAVKYRETATECGQSLLLLLSLTFPAVTHERRTDVKREGHTWHTVIALYPEEITDDVHSEILSVSLSQRNDRGIPNLDMQTDDMYGAEALQRSLQREAAHLCEPMSAYLRNTELDPYSVFRYDLSLPESWKSILGRSLADEAHNYIVAKALERFFLPYNADLADRYAREADEAKGNLKYILTMRLPGFFSRPYQPF